MTFNEVAVVVVGAFAGYWIIDAVVNKSPSSKNKTSTQTADETVERNSAEGSGSDNESDYAHYIASHWWSILGVAEDAGKGEIEAAHQQLLAECHPDKVAHMGQEMRELAALKARKIQDAYEYGMSQAQ